MNTRRWLLAVAFISGVASSIATANASSVLIDFESFGDVGVSGPAVTNQYPDVVFSSTPGYQNLVTSQPGIGFGLNFICTGAGSIDCAQETILTFANPVDNLSFWQVGDDSSGVVAKVDVLTYDMIVTVDILGDSLFNSPNFVDLTAYTHVSSIRIHSITDPGGLGWDNFSFDTAVVGVPEPDTLLILAFGLGCLGVLLARRNRARKE